MAGTPLLVDTDILIDYLRGIRPARELIDSARFEIYYSSWTRKELLTMPGLRSAQRSEIIKLLSGLRLVPVTDEIASVYWQLLTKYSSNGLLQADAVIAATAVALNAALITRNKKHFRFIQEIQLAPVY